MAIVNANIADNGHLILVEEDGSVIDAGNVRGIPGPQGERGVGVKGDRGDPGPAGTNGKDGGGLKGFASGYVNAGTFVTLDNIKATVTTSGARGLSVATVSGTMAVSISGYYAFISGAAGSATSYPGPTYTTTPSGSWFGWSFPNAGDGSVYLVNDYNNQRFYRITLMIGAGYNNNFISIERLY